MAESKPAVISANFFLKSAEKLLAGLERDAKTSERETEPLRKELTRDTKDIGTKALDSLATEEAGRTRRLLPTTKNLARVKDARERVRERFSRFNLQWLDRSQVRSLITEGFDKADRANFFRHSNRLARNARLFLNRLGELEPSLQDEIDATLRQMDDASQNLLKLEVRSFTHLQESLLREMNGRSTRSDAIRSWRTFDLNRNLYNLSLLEHPKGVVRDLLAQASERMAARRVSKKSLIPGNSLVFVSAGPQAVEDMTTQSRASRLLFRVFSGAELTKRFAELNKARQTTSTWRDLGLGHNSPEWYVPIPPEIEDEVREAMAERRSDFVRSLEVKEAANAAQQEADAQREVERAQAKQDALADKEKRRAKRDQ